MASSPPPRIFDPGRRKALRSRAERLSARQDVARFVLDDMVDDVIERAGFMQLAPARSLIIGDSTGDSIGEIAAALAGPDREILQSGADILDDEAPLTLDNLGFIACLNCLDTVNDLPGVLIHLRNALAPGGVLIASIVGAGSLPNLRAAMLAADGDRPAARMHPMVDNRSAAALLQRCGFARQVVDSHGLDVRYSSLDRLVQDLRAQGLSNVLSSRTPPLSRTALQTARDAFLVEADENGRVTERFEILTLTAWKN